jgi:hypothetical protein
MAGAIFSSDFLASPADRDYYRSGEGAIMIVYFVAVALALAAMAAPGLAQTAQQWKCTGNPDYPWDDCRACFTEFSASPMIKDRAPMRRAGGVWWSIPHNPSPKDYFR